jgi:hypothetical protein
MAIPIPEKPLRNVAYILIVGGKGREKYLVYRTRSLAIAAREALQHGGKLVELVKGEFVM